MKARPWPAAGLLVVLAGVVLHSAELEQTVFSAYQAFLEGRLADARSAYRYLATIGVSVPDPEANLALLARDQGDNDFALAQWMKASLSPNADGLLWDQRGWAYLSADRTREAKDAFLKGIDRSTTTATQAEANLGLGLVALRERLPKSGMEALRSALVQGPYALSSASYETALLAQALHDRSAALAYLRQSAEVDARNFEAVLALARFEDKIGETRVAWGLYQRLLALDPKNQEFAKRIQKLSEFISGDPQLAMPVRRLPRPILDPAADQGVAPVPGSSATMRVALFSDLSGKPVTATRFYLMANGNFKLVALNGEVLNDNGRAFDQWEIAFRTESNLVEVRDPAGNIEYTAKQPFKIVPEGRRGTVVVKSANFLKAYGFDRGDRELRGTLEVLPTPDGFKLVNEARLEDYLFGVVGAALPQGSPTEAYKAEAVAARTLALWSKGQAVPAWERSDICDSVACQRYDGVSSEMQAASKAVAATEGLVLTQAGRIAHVAQHEDCGGTTEAGAESGDASLAHLASIHDGPMSSAPLRTPLDLERWTHNFPPKDLYCEAGNIGQSHSRWIRMIDAEGLKERAARIKFIGEIRNLRVAGRTPTGRARALVAEGTRGELRFEGARAIEEFLSPGSLRSTLFTVTPVLKGNVAERFILWGAGTGSGFGMCLAGAIGQASLGRDFRTILVSYFPELKVESLHEQAASGRKVASAKKGGKRRHLNPRLHPR